MGRGAAEVGLNKILLFPEKLRALHANGPESRDLSYPVSVELSLTNRCDQNCLWCSDRDLRRRCPDNLSLPVLREFFADLARGGTRGITVEGGGEPTLALHFEAALKEARLKGLALGLITNGLNLFPRNRDPGLYRLFEWIRVSLDAATAEQYRSLKGRDGFEEVLSNLNRLAEEAPETTLGVGYVLTCRNDQPEPLSQLARRLDQVGAHYLQIRPVVDHPDLKSNQDIAFIKNFETDRFSVNLAPLTENRPFGNLGLPCLAHSLSVVIGADGAVWLCGRLNTETTAQSLGNLNREPFRQIWLGPERARQTALAASPEYCLTHCPQCRMTKFNRLLADLKKIKTRNFI